MSRRGRVGIEPGHGSRAPVSDEQWRAVQRLVRGHARDAADATHLLDVLGLLPAPDRTPEDPR